MTIKHRVERQLDNLNQTKSWLAAELAVEKQNLNNWITRGKIPERYLFKASRLLSCDAEWLASGKETATTHQVSEPRSTYQVDRDLEKEINKLSPADTEKVASFIQGLKAGRS
ncbi:helix-turn-helix domain containing protein [Porticoccaceae bacterium]|nr:helix-turn-helix domain containing protein [Porticoccaceae bacterium]